MGGRPKIPAPIPPPPPPDFADQAVRDASLSERQKQLASASRRKSFVSGSSGSASVLPVAAKKLLGA